MKQIIRNQVELECIQNAHGVKVNMGCMSCQHRLIVEGSRFCDLNQEQVAPRAICPEWQMSDGLKNAGLDKGGKIRIREKNNSLN